MVTVNTGLTQTLAALVNGAGSLWMHLCHTISYFVVCSFNGGITDILVRYHTEM